MKKVLFICTHNSARSQMAEAFLNHMYGSRYTAESAGTVATQVNPYAIAVMEELGISMEGHRSKSIEEFRGRIFDVVITVCDSAREACPFFPGKVVIHRGFDDPSSYHVKRGKNTIRDGPNTEKLAVFRRVRDEIKEWIEEEFGRMGMEQAAPSLNLKRKSAMD